MYVIAWLVVYYKNPVCLVSPVLGSLGPGSILGNQCFVLNAFLAGPPPAPSFPTCFRTLRVLKSFYIHGSYHSIKSELLDHEPFLPHLLPDPKGAWCVPPSSEISVFVQCISRRSSPLLLPITAARHDLL